MRQLSGYELRILAEIKLRNLVKDMQGIAEYDISERCKFAADEIERLLAENKRLEAELEGWQEWARV